ncbi:hypothetical protein DCO58_08340 [Helicobacter saguini]|uniref:Uncharacterized protein n=1 Tax=Helicobacter saguini TaxID=1548018 RepID=A0A347VNR5_9HELI|nr:hypothetical protein [Helicobacter saguini]MWV61667.1 hypothetical protein [Helicobacter saguini]MWV67660.1 hypothetical protein [Helicobacter saguini]MWV70013.1 hypothetical protein [Helicobacter saguini]MWV72774.1 hypothetical protein [Helicobacter saguini]TLD92714.1 hypothetical protein LS64_009835 [Helicobacter saguini]
MADLIKEDSIESKVETKAEAKADSKVETQKDSKKIESKKQTKVEAKADSNTLSEKHKNLESFIASLSPQEAKAIKTFINSSVYDTFMTYLEGIFREKDTLIHRINCYCFRAIDDVSIRILGKVYSIKKGEIIYIQKDAYGNSLLKNNKLERIM